MTTQPILSLSRQSRATRGLKAATAAAFALGLIALSASHAANAQASLASRPHKLLIPASSQAQPGDLGMRAHTNVRLLIPATSGPAEAPPYSGYGYETPASLACVYELVQPIRGCNPNETTRTPQGGSESIAIVDAYDDPNAASDLATFATQFGVPFNPAKFKVVYASGTEPAPDPTGGWEFEESLDIEYAHAMAPNATLYLVEAASNYNSDLYPAVTVATNLVRCGQVTTCPAGAKGKGEVSMSWGGDEFAQEAELDGFFTGANVVYVASAGDAAGVIYPSASPNVVSAGGTSNARSLDTGNLIGQIAWSDAGGGSSEVEPRPSYQAPIARYAGAYRATPDISSDSNPTTGMWVFDSIPYEGESNPSDWWVAGGTSAAAPTISGILNAAATVSGKFAASTSAELKTVYSDLDNPLAYWASFTDVTYGACNYYSATFSSFGYDYCTGVGTPNTLFGK